MAVVAQNGLDPNQQQQPNMGGSGTITGSPGMATAGGGGGTAYQGSGASNAPRANPSGAPNIQDYLNANQNAGNKLSSGITNNYQNQANQYQQGLSSQQQNLNSQYNPLNQQVSQQQQSTNTAFQNPQALLSAYQASQSQNAAAPNQSALNNYNNFESTLGGTQQNQQLNQGIAGYQNSGQQAGNYLQAQLGQLGQTAALGANAMGQKELLQQTVGTPNYTPGQQNLDALFLQGKSNQLQNNLNSIYGQASGNTNAASQDYQSKLNALQQMAGQNAAYTKNLFLNGAPGQQGTGLNQIGANVQNEYNNLAQTAPAAQAAMQQAFNKNQFSPDQLKQLGLTQGMHTWGLTPQELMNAGNYQAPALQTGAAGFAQAANPEEFARYNALNQLAGGAAGTLQPSIFGSASTTGYNPISFDPKALQSAIDAKQKTITDTDFNAQKQAAVNAYNNLGYAGSSAGLAFRQEMGNALQNAKTPEEVNDAINKYSYYFNALGNPTGAYENWYNNTYTPAETATLDSSPVAYGTSPVSGGQIRPQRPT